MDVLRPVLLAASGVDVLDEAADTDTRHVVTNAIDTWHHITSNTSSLPGVTDSAIQMLLCEAIDESATLLTAMQQHSSALRAAAAAHALRKAAITTDNIADHEAEMLAMSVIRLAGALNNRQQYVEGLKALHIASQTLGPSLSLQTVALLHRQEAALHECAGDCGSALVAVEEANIALGHSAQGHGLQSRRRHLQTLRRALSSEAAQVKFPANYRHRPEVQIQAAVERSRKHVESTLAAIVSDGPWESAAQLPKHFVPGLPSQPFFELSNHHNSWGVTKNAMLLRAAAHVQQHAVWTALRDEYRTLERDGRMHPQQECIEHVRFDGDVSHLLWHQFSATVRAHSAAADHSSKPVGQIMTGGLWCATELTPVACNLLNTLSVKFKLQMLHAGYSALSAGGQLREHFGQTNAQLKWHLGLIVPSAPTHDCVWLQVDGQLRAPGWTEGQLTIFDDSFAHAAGNNCAEKRVVLQLVMKHPGIW